MSEQIKKSDISEKDVYGWIVESAKMAGVAVGELNKQLQESARISKETLGKSKSFGNYNEVKQAEIAMKELNKQYQLKIKLEAEALNAERKLMSAQRLYNAEVEKQINAEKKKAQAVQNTQSAYARINVALSNLKKEYRDLAVVQELGGKLDEAQAKRLQTLEGRIKKFDGALKQVDAGMGNYQRNVGNYASATNNLGFAFAQITREGPAFANSMQTGFMAISNNLPMLFDEIMRVNKANKELQAQGQPTQSMFESLAGAIFSFQTMLSIGVTLLTIYGKELVNMAIGLDYAEESQKRLNTAMEESNEFTSEIIKNLESKMNWDKLSRKEAIERVKAEIELARYSRKEFKKNAEETIKEIKSLSWWERNRSERLKERLLAQQQTIRTEEQNIIKLKEYLDQLRLQEYQEAKSTKTKKEKTKELQTEINLTQKLIDIDKIYNEALQDRYNFQTKQLDRQLKERVKAEINAAEQRGKYNIESIDEILEAEKNAQLNRLELEYELNKEGQELGVQNYKDSQKFQQDKILLDQEYADKRKGILNDLNTAQEKFNEQQLDNDKKTNAKRLEEQKRAFKVFKEYVDLSLEYFIEKSEQKIAQIDKEIEKAEEQQDYLKELAQQGNITAQQSLAEQQKIIDEANKKKIREQRRIERLKLAESALDIYQTKVENGDKTPLISTIKDITLLKTFINSLPAFYEGIENTGKNGKGLDGKGGFLSVLHPYERVVPADENAKIGDLTNKDLADVAYKYNSGQLVDLGGRDTAGTTYDLYPLLKEMRELKETIENKPQTNIELGEITQSVMNIVQTTQKGNKTTRKAFVIRKR